jgi:tRNA pseudouridine38-40 synthase
MRNSHPLKDRLQAESTGQWQLTQRVAVVVQYLGTHFHGWQRQPRERTVQGEIEAAIATVLGQEVSVHGAGRTDAGVHASAQVAHFNVPAVIPAHRWRDILNARLPKDVLIRASNRVPDHWHAQFSASWRRYRYTIYTDPTPNLFLRPLSWHYYYEPFRVSDMQQALEPLVGQHDLTAFHRARSGRSHSWVDVQFAGCQQSGSLLTIELQANGFLYGMVRLIMGLLVQVGRGQMTPDEFTGIWQNRQRQKVKYAAPAQGLCLLRVGYDFFPFPADIWFDTLPHFCLQPAPEKLAV